MRTAILGLALALLLAACGDRNGYGDDDDGTARPDAGGAPALAEDCQNAISWRDLDLRVDEDVAVIGPVLDVTYDTARDLIVVQIGAARPEPQGLDVVIPGTARERFTPPPEAFKDQQACALGAVALRGDRYEIAVASPADLAFAAAPLPTIPVRSEPCEDAVSWARALDHDGEVVAISGPAVGLRTEESRGRRLHIIEVGVPAPEAGGFDIAILESEIGDFRALDTFVGNPVCARGAVSVLGGRARVYVTDQVDLDIDK